MITALWVFAGFSVLTWTLLAIWLALIEWDWGFIFLPFTLPFFPVIWFFEGQIFTKKDCKTIRDNIHKWRKSRKAEGGAK